MISEPFLNLNLRPFLFLVLVTFLAFSPAFAQTGAGRAEAVVLSDGREKYPLGRYLEILRDPSGELTFQDVTSSDLQDQFTISQVDTPNFGFQKAAYWVRFRIQNQAQQTNNWVLELEFNNMHYMDLYLPSPDGAGYIKRESGIFRPVDNRDYFASKLSFNLDVPTGSEQTIYLRFQNQASMTLSLLLWSQSAYIKQLNLSFILLGCFYGFSLLIALYNLILFFIIRDRAHLYLVLFITAYIVFFLFYDGAIFLFVPITTNRWATAPIIICLGISSFAVIKFHDSFVALNKRLPKFHRYFNYLVGISLLFSFIAVFVDYRLLATLWLLFSNIAVLSILVMLLVLWRTGYQLARFLLFTWFLFLVGSLVVNFTRLGILSSTGLTEEAFRIGFFSLVFLSSLALANRVNFFKGEAEAINRQLLEREERFRATFEQAAVGIAHVSLEGRFIRINRKFCEIVGYSRDEMMAFNFRDITHPDDLEADLNYVERLLNRKIQSYSIEKRYLHKDGERIWVSLTVSLLCHQTGEPNYFIAVVEDITLRKKAEEQLRFQAHLLDAVEQAVIVTDMQGRVVYWNPFAERMYGWSEEEAIGKTTIELIGSEENHQQGIEIMERLQAGESWSGEYLARRRDDSLLPIQLVNSPIYDREGTLQHIVGISSDISLRKQAEEALRQSEELQRLALEGAGLGIWLNDLVSGELIWDDRAREIFAVDPEVNVTMDLGFSLIHPDDRDRAREAFERAIDPQSDGLYELKNRVVCPDSQVRWISSRGRAIFEGQGPERRAVRLIGIVMDITENVVTEQLLEESLSRYRMLVEIMNEGLGVVDAQDRFTYVNPRLAEMLGYAPVEMIGRPIYEFFNQENRAIIADQLARRREGEEQPYTVTWCHKNGFDLHTLVAPAVVFDQDGKYLSSIAVVTDISDQVRAKEVLDQRVMERTHELSTLLKISRVVASTLELEPLLQVILQELKSVVDFEGAAIYSIKDHHLSTLNFPLLVAKEKAILQAQPLIREISQDERAVRSEPFIISDLQDDREDARYFRHIAADFLELNSGKIRSWMGIPLKFKDQLVGLLSIHHHLVDYYTATDARLAFAFANQAAVAIENARLYQQAQDMAASQERNRLARELHDSVTQALYSLILYAGATRAALQSGKSQVAEKNLAEVVTVAREGMRDLRLLIFELRPPMLEDEGLAGALQIRLEAVENRAGLQTKFHMEGKPNLSSEVEKELYWSLHEALNNILKHAHAKNIWMNLCFRKNSATITLKDDGVGFEASNYNWSNGMGLKNIADRVEKIGGKLRIESKMGEGTALRIELDL